MSARSKQTRPLNSRLSGLHDGAVVPSVELTHWDGIKAHIGRVRVYWPFVTLRSDNPGYCFKQAGWHTVRRDDGSLLTTKDGKHLLEKDLQEPAGRLG